MATPITFDERKTNERPGVRAVHRHARFSAYKAREVLDLIRGKSVSEARTILEFCDRGAADDIIKVLDSAVANAANNNDIPPEELFVGACYADEGPTMKRWRPRARGRATRIRKRTCHITVIVSRYSVDELTARRERLASKGRSTVDAGQNRARRVAKSRSGSSDEAADAKAAEEVVDDAAAAEDADVPAEEPKGSEDVAAPAEDAADEAASDAVETNTDEAAAAEDAEAAADAEKKDD